MRLKIKYSSTKKFVLNFEGSTLGQLTAAVIKFIADTYGEDCPQLVLSLNGRDALTAAPETPLATLGVVPSDLLSVLTGDAAVAAAVAAAAAGGSSAATADAATAAGCGAGAGGGSAEAGAAGGGSSGVPVAAMASVPTGEEESIARLPDVPYTLLDVSNTEDAALPHFLQHLLQHCSPASAAEAVNLLAHLTMQECGFRAEGSTQAAPRASSAGDDDTGTKNKKDFDLPGSGWNGMVASLNYTHGSFENFSCTLVLVSMGKLKQIMVSFPNQDVEISTKVTVDDYIVEGRPTELRNVSKLAQKLRNDLLVPLQIAANRILGLPSPFHLAGLPEELLLIILKKLDIRSALQLSTCCKRIHKVTTDNSLWQFYYRRDMGSPPTRYTEQDSNPEWMKLYKELYEQKKNSNIGWNSPQSFPEYGGLPRPRIYPTGPEFPSPNHPYPHQPQPYGPYPTVPDPTPPFNPYLDPDSPHYGGEIPNHPPNPLNPFGGRGGGYPLGPFGGGGDPLNPLGDPSFGGLGPGLPGRPRNPRGGPGGGPGFRFI